MTKDEALRLALEALQNPWKAGPNGVADAIIAIKAALEAKDEPYALEASMFSNDRVKVDPVTGNVSIGTRQRTWVGLTDVEIVDIMDAELTTQNTEHFALCRAIEAKLKEKNT
jgi:hypothetical protein